jgi:Flp pilus assembly pilin Flp
MTPQFFLRASSCTRGLGTENAMARFIQQIWTDDEGQDIAEYAVMLAVILVLVVGTVRLIGSNTSNAFSAVASSLQ